MVENLYARRNALLNKATSFKGKDSNETIKVRTACFIEADEVTKMLEETWAGNSVSPPPLMNLYDEEGNITHLMLTDDGINRKYVRVNSYIPSQVKIEPLSPLERLRYHELKASQEELQFIEDVKALSKVLTPEAL